MSQLSPEKEGAEILVPLTNCMYVPGNIVQVHKLLLNIGTGYYVEKVRGGVEVGGARGCGGGW